MSEEQKENKKLLVVDDDEFLLDMYSMNFEEAGFEVDTAMDGKEGLEKLREEKFNILLLDLVMPEIDGFDVLETINEEELREGLVIIVLTNQGSSEKIEKAKEKGVDGYIVKASAVPSEVLEKVKEIAGVEKEGGTAEGDSSE